MVCWCVVRRTCESSWARHWCSPQLVRLGGLLCFLALAGQPTLGLMECSCADPKTTKGKAAVQPSCRFRAPKRYAHSRAETVVPSHG